MNDRLDTIREKLEELRKLMPGQADLLEEIGKKAAEEGAKAGGEPSAEAQPPEPAVSGAYETLKLARASDRPHGIQYISALTEDFIELHGARAYADDRPLWAASRCSADARSPLCAPRRGGPSGRRSSGISACRTRRGTARRCAL